MPFLYLLYEEEMHTYLNAQETGIQGLRSPLSEEELIDSEFADDVASIEQIWRLIRNFLWFGNENHARACRI